MSGYASRKEPAEGKVHELWAKALVLDDGQGHRGVVVTMDLIGIKRELSLKVVKQLMKKYDLPRAAIILNVSHTHCGPVVGQNLTAMYFLDDKQRKLIDDYAETLQKRIIEVVGKAIANLKPAELSWGIGKTTFATNRRENRAEDVPHLRQEGKLKGPFDHDVPVLAVRSKKGKLIGVLFGYACHATTMSFNKWCGDYPGFAQIEIEKAFPGAVGLFWAGCGGDQNPLPRRKLSLAEKYGQMLAKAVAKVLQGKMKRIKGTLAMSYIEIDLPFADLPTREQIAQDMLSKNRYIASRAKLLMARMKQAGKLNQTYPYPIQAWRIGKNDVKLVALGGEVVVDYALRLKKEISPGNTWVMGYSNDVMAYIPSLRVLKEGGYEGARAMIYYGQPTVWSPRVEELIVDAVHKQIKKVSQVK